MAVQAAFQSYDVDGSGGLTWAEVSGFLRRCLGTVPANAQTLFGEVCPHFRSRAVLGPVHILNAIAIFACMHSWDRFIFDLVVFANFALWALAPELPGHDFDDHLHQDQGIAFGSRSGKPLFTSGQQ